MNTSVKSIFKQESKHPISRVLLDLSDRSDMFYWQTNRRITAQEQKEIFLDRHRVVRNEDVISAVEYGVNAVRQQSTPIRVVSVGSPAAFGSVNSMIRVSLSDGTDVVIRVHPYGVKNGYFYVEKVAASLAKQAGVPTFETFYINDEQKDFPFDFMIMEALTGKTMQEYWLKDMEHDAARVFDTGRCVALIHKVHPEGYGFFKNDIAKHTGTLRGQYKTFAEHIYAALHEDLTFLIEHKVLSLTQGDKAVRIFDTHKDLMECNTPSLIHNDIADWNSLTDGKRITGIVDWDECFSGDPVMDFAQWSLFYNNDRLTHFIEGYTSVAPLPYGYAEKDHLFRLRYVISKLHLRKKRSLVMKSSSLQEKITRGMEVLAEEFTYFGIAL